MSSEYIPWENQKNAIRNEVEKMFSIAEEKGVFDLSFSCKLSPDGTPTFKYTVDRILYSMGKPESEIIKEYINGHASKNVKEYDMLKSENRKQGVYIHDSTRT